MPSAIAACVLISPRSTPSRPTSTASSARPGSESSPRSAAALAAAPSVMPAAVITETWCTCNAANAVPLSAKIASICRTRRER